MQIQVTQDYPLFKRIKGNRAVSKPHISRLLQAIKTTPDSVSYNPIVVNDKFEIIDGQHRFEAIKQLSLPVYYIQVDDLTLQTVQQLNSVSKAWSPMDYAKSYAELGNKNYQIYIDFKERYKFNHDILMKYLALDNPITSTAFNSGLFKVFNTKLSSELCRELTEVGQYYDRFNIRSFALGFLQVARNSDYDQTRMLNQLSKHGDKINEQALPNDWARELERIYNYKQRDNVRLF